MFGWHKWNYGQGIIGGLSYPLTTRDCKRCGREEFLLGTEFRVTRKSLLSREGRKLMKYLMG